MRELKERFNLDRRTIQKHIDSYTLPKKIHHPRPIHLLVDATHFGKRTEKNDWCAVVARDMYRKECLVWYFRDQEDTTVYVMIRQELEALGYTILSVTGDGFSGIRAAFKGIPFQMCHVHMERIVTRKITTNPKLEAGKVLLALVKSLHDTNSYIFRTRLNEYILMYRDFLNEKSLNYDTGREEFTHRNLRSAVRSLRSLTPFLFTFEHDERIHRTTNSLEGFFRHVKRIVRVHCGISRAHLEKVLSSIFLVGSTGKSMGELEKIL
jgi:hypothetical protein